LMLLRLADKSEMLSRLDELVDVGSCWKSMDCCTKAEVM